MNKDKNSVSAIGLVKNLREIFSTLTTILALVKRPNAQNIRARIFEDSSGKFICIRFSDQYYQWNETLEKTRLFEFEYEITSRGITMVGYQKYNEPKPHAFTVEYWSHGYEENSTIRLIDLPRGKYGPHADIIRRHFANLAAWSWAVAC